MLRVRIGRFEGDVDAIEAEWKLECLEGQTWEALTPLLYGREPRHPGEFGRPSARSRRGQRLERRFGLRVGQNEVLGLAPGRYRVSLKGLGGEVAESVEVDLPPSGAASCELGVPESD